MKYKLGYTATYIQDHKFKHLCNIPKEVALVWVKTFFPLTDMGGGIIARNLTINGNIDTDISINGWLNKLFILVNEKDGKYIAITKWDDRFSLYIER